MADARQRRRPARRRLPGERRRLGVSAPADSADTPYLGDADFGEITLPPAPAGETRVVLQMTAEGRVWFGEKRDFTLVAE